MSAGSVCASRACASAWCSGECEVGDVLGGALQSAASDESAKLRERRGEPSTSGVAAATRLDMSGIRNGETTAAKRVAALPVR